MVFKNFFNKAKSTLKNLNKKIRNERKKLFAILTKLQNNLERQKYIRSYCHNQAYYNLLGNELNRKFCELSEKIDKEAKMLYSLRVHIANEIGLLEKVLNAYNKEIHRAEQKGLSYKKQELEKIKLEILAAAKEHVQEKKILEEIEKLYNEKHQLLEKLQNEIKNEAIIKDLKKLNKLINEEKDIINTLKKYIKKEENMINEENKITKEYMNIKNIKS